MKSGAEKRAARVGQACRCSWQLGTQHVEAVALLHVHGIVRFVGAGQMAHDQRGLEGGQEIGLGRQLRDVALRHAKPVDPGVDMQGCGKPASAGLAVGGPIANLGEAREGRAQIEARIVGLCPGQETVEHIDGGARLHFARGASLIDGGDEKSLAAFTGQRPGDGRQAQAIGIGLDDACAFRAARDLVEPRPVGAQGGRSTLRTARADNGIGARVRGKPVGAGVVAVNPSSLECRRPAPDRRSA